MSSQSFLNHAAMARRVAVSAACAAVVGCATPVAQQASHDYPTLDRVIYVESCVAQHPGPRFEMISKCSCAIDLLATQLSREEFDEMTTATNANSIGGERGNYIRDVEILQKDIRRFRDLQTKAQQACFITSQARR